MRVITTTNLLTKYNITEDTAMALLKTLSPDVDILPTGDCHAVKAHVDTVNDSILIVGGNDVVPFFVLPNPSIDPDQSVTSDAPYACTHDPLYYTPDKVVGRLPDEDNNHQFDFLQTVIAAQAAHMASKPSTIGWFNMVASVWKPISDFMNQKFNMANQNVVPPVTQPTLDIHQISGKRYFYVNLHGTTQTPYFYGQGPAGYPVALQPTPGFFKDGFAFFEACYGGYLNARNRNTSIPLQALFSGAVGVISSTEIAYGPAAPPTDCADALSYCFYNRLLAGENVGLAFMHAKQDFSTMIIHRGGNLEPSNKKTLLSFNLYGSPDISM